MSSSRRARRRDARLVPVALGVWLVAAVLLGRPELAPGGALVLWLSAGAALLVALRLPTRWRTALALVAVTLAAGGAVAVHVMAAEPARAAVRAQAVDGGRVLSLDITTVGKIERSPTGFRFDGVLHSLQLGDQEPVAVPAVAVLVRAEEIPEGVDLGARIHVTATAWRPDVADRAVLIVESVGQPQLVTPAQGPLAIASALRQGLRGVTAGLPDPGGGLIAGLAVGDTGAVTDSLDAAMKTSSLSHLTAVSGANCALVVGVAFAVAAACGARRGVRVAAGAAALAGFVILVSPEPSVVRAAVMAAIAMLALLLGRAGAGLSVLCAAVIVLLIVDPWLALSIGFALSTAATGALLVLAGPLADGLARWMPHPLALAISVPLAAQLACGPLIVLIAPQVSVYGVVANLLAAPAAPLGTMIGLAACLCAGIPLLGSGLATLAWLPAAWIAGVATTFAALPGSALPWADGVAGLAGLTVAGAAVCALIMMPPGRARRVTAAVVAVVVACVAAAAPTARLIERARTPGAWAIAACDVGQGDAILVRSGTQIALIDTGPDPELLRACLDVLGVDRLALLVLTHFDLDHRGGLDAVTGRVDQVLHGPPGDAADEARLARLSEAGATVTAATRGMGGRLGEAHWRVLAPRLRAAPGNDASVVLDVSGGGIPSILLLGDLSETGQLGMRAGAALQRDYDVVKVAHHGSADQDPELYRWTRPAVALVTVGENDYGHPRAEILTHLSALGARITRSDRDGLVLLWRADDGIRLWREHATGAVAPDG